MRMTAEEVLIVALMDILVFKPTEGAGDPYQQMAVYAKSRATEALQAWKGNNYAPAAPSPKESQS